MNNMEMYASVFIQTIKNDLKKVFWHSLTSDGDINGARNTIRHYIHLYNILKKELKEDEREFVKESIEKINRMLIDEQVEPELVNIN